MTNVVASSVHQSEVSCSAERNTFQRDSYLRGALAKGQKESDPDVRAILDIYDRWGQDDQAKIADPEWQKNNLEYDLRSTEWILEKVRGDDVYAQHIYAALCNTEWQQTEPWPILKNESWSCSWRHAGGIVADMCGRGDYVDWYCSGMGQQPQQVDTIEGSISVDWLAQALRKQAAVAEGCVTDEVRQDFLKLGWQQFNLAAADSGI